MIISSRLRDWHIVEVEVWGPGDVSADRAFHVKTVRRNPATFGAVTGSATYASFLSSMLGEGDRHIDVKDFGLTAVYLSGYF